MKKKIIYLFVILLPVLLIGASERIIGPGEVIRVKPTTIPSSGNTGEIRFDTSTNKLKAYNGSTWSELGGGGTGGITYFSDFQADTIGNVSTYDDTSATPVDLTGGTPSTVSTSSETSTPLSLLASYKLSKSAANGQGEGFSIASSTLDYLEATSSQPIFVTFNYKTSAGYASNDVTIYVYKVGSNTLEALDLGEGSNGLISCQTGCVATGVFSASSSDTSFRLGLHIATTNASAYDITLDRIKAGPDSFIPGPIITNGKAYSLTIGGSTSAPSIGSTTTNRAIWYRVGDKMIIQYQLDQDTAGSAGSGTYLFPLPSGYTIDTLKLTPSTGALQPAVGSATVFDGSAVYGGNVVAYNSTNLAITVGSNATGPGYVASGFLPLTNADTRYSFTATIPITDWDTGASISTTETLFSTVKARYTASSTSAVPGTATVFDFNTEDYDTHNAVKTGASWVFTAPKKAKYRVKALIHQNGSVVNAFVISIRKNSTAVATQSEPQEVAASYTSNSQISTFIELDKGDTLDVTHHEVINGATYTGGAVSQYIEIESLPDFSIFSVWGKLSTQESNSAGLVAFPITISQWGDLTSLTLEPGEYILIGNASVLNGATLSAHTNYVGISTTSGNSSSGMTFGDSLSRVYNPGTTSFSDTIHVTLSGVTVTSQTTYYLKSYSDVTTNLNIAYKFQAIKVK